MILLDTDVLTLVQRDDSAASLKVRARIAQLPPNERVGTTIITYQEHSRGWLAYVAKARTKPQQIDGYRRLASHLDDYRHALVIGYDPAAADRFDELRRDHPRLGTLDLKIAAVALANDALLVSRNLRQIDGLRVEDWTA